jgi:hypothetical protein
MREKVILLLPLRFNDGSGVPKDTLDGFLLDLYTAYDGYTLVGEVEGAYRMQSGGKQIDTCLQVWVAVESSPDVFEGLKQRVANFGAVLGQETMYLERTGSAVEFIPAAPQPEPRNEHDQ